MCSKLWDNFPKSSSFTSFSIGSSIETSGNFSGKETLGPFGSLGGGSNLTEWRPPKRRHGIHGIRGILRLAGVICLCSSFSSFPSLGLKFTAPEKAPVKNHDLKRHMKDDEADEWGIHVASRFIGLLAFLDQKHAHTYFRAVHKSWNWDRTDPLAQQTQYKEIQ